MRNTRYALLLGFLFLICAPAFSQNVLDRAYVRDQSNNRKPVPYTHLREADVMWHHRVWRTLDMREKINHPLYYPIEPIKDRKSLFDVIKSGLFSDPPQLTAYGNAATDDEFTVKLNKLELYALMVKNDTLLVPKLENPDEMEQKITTDSIGSGQVKQYWIKEDWFFDKQRSVMDVRIIGICPLAEVKDDKGEVKGVKALFWIYFPEARPLFARSEVFNRKNSAERRTLDDIFWKRQFGSFIHREYNVYDRWINGYKANKLDQLLESERIKEDVFFIEHDLWHF